MTASPDTSRRSDAGLGPCGPDCIYVEDACRCYHGEPAPVGPAWLSHIKPAF